MYRLAARADPVLSPCFCFDECEPLACQCYSIFINNLIVTHEGFKLIYDFINACQRCCLIDFLYEVPDILRKAVGIRIA